MQGVLARGLDGMQNRALEGEFFELQLGAHGESVKVIDDYVDWCDGYSIFSEDSEDVGAEVRSENLQIPVAALVNFAHVSGVLNAGVGVV